MFADQTTIPLPAFYYQSEDPAVTYPDGRVAPFRMWLDTSGGGLVWKMRNATNDGWVELLDLAKAVEA